MNQLITSARRPNVPIKYNVRKCEVFNQIARGDGENKQNGRKGESVKVCAKIKYFMNIQRGKHGKKTS